MADILNTLLKDKDNFLPCGNLQPALLDSAAAPLVSLFQRHRVSAQLISSASKPWCMRDSLCSESKQHNSQTTAQARAQLHSI